MKIAIITMMLVAFFTTTSVSAVTLNLISPAGREVVVFDKQLSFNNDVSLLQDKVLVNISEKDGKPIMNSMIYLCKDRNPSSCVGSVKPIKHSGSMDSTFLRSDVSDSGGGYLLFFVEVETGYKQSVWVSDLVFVDKGVSYPSSYEADVDLNTNLNDTKDALFKTGTLPMGFINSMQFKGKDIYQLVGEPVSAGFRGEKYLNFTYNKLEKSVQRIKGFSFVFPAGQGIFSPVSIYNLEESCGDAFCGLGESYNTCWRDCKCPSGQFPGSKGCTSDSIPITVDSIGTGSLKCISAMSDDECSMLPSTVELKIHIENPPVDYRLNSQYFYFGSHFISGQDLCVPDEPHVRKDLGGGRFVYINSAKNYTCSVPSIILKKSDVGDITHSIYFSLSYDTQNGTEVKEASGQATLNVDDIWPSNLLTLQEKLDEAKSIPTWLKYALKITTAVEVYTGVMAVASCICCAVPVCSAGGACPACGAYSAWTALFEAIRQILNLAGAYCTGVYQPQIFGIPVDDTTEIKGGSGRDAAAAVSSACRQIIRNQDLIRQQVGLAREKQQVFLTGALQHLVWIYGESSGYSPKAVCGNENVQIWYSLDSFQCNKDLWFNINSNKRPFCDKNQVFTTQTPLGVCDFTNTSDYVWGATDPSGNIARQYNTTGYHMLYNGSAQNLFAGSDIINITISCSSEAYGDITDTLKLAEYESLCAGGKAAQTVNILNPDILNNPDVSVV